MGRGSETQLQVGENLNFKWVEVSYSVDLRPYICIFLGLNTHFIFNNSDYSANKMY